MMLRNNNFGNLMYFLLLCWLGQLFGCSAIDRKPVGDKKLVGILEVIGPNAYLNEKMLKAG